MHPAPDAEAAVVTPTQLRPGRIAYLLDFSRRRSWHAPRLGVQGSRTVVVDVRGTKQRRALRLGGCAFSRLTHYGRVSSARTAPVIAATPWSRTAGSGAKFGLWALGTLANLAIGDCPGAASQTGIGVEGRNQ